MVTDVGSTKRAVVAGRDDERFVGGHPLAGGEAAGVEHAREDLFADQTWYLTPTAGSSGVLLERLHRAITGLGARPAIIDAETHDALMAAISHLPHLLANVLVGQAARALGGERLPPTGPSFRDATRVAGANPALWEGIYLANRDALGAAIDDALQRLTEARDALAARRRPVARGLAARVGGRAPGAAGRRPGRRAARPSCGPPCPTGRGSSPRSRSRSGARASTSPTWRSPHPRTTARARSPCG